ncbi:MAG: response regulator transcription factor [Oscillospiraceae bacterium]|nr:response regulator transcription factor [Oscillospiraceae bacterium]
MKKILIIDDDMHIGNALEETLVQAGYHVNRAYSGTEAIFALSQISPDLVLLDLMLPGLNGEEVLPYIKDIPVIIISAKTDIENKVNLLLKGAMDYVTKPFNTKELLARIAVQLRTFENCGKKLVLSFDDITLNTENHEVKIKDTEVRLTRTEYAILKILIQNQANIISKSTLLERIYENTPDCTESSLKTHISHLRTKLSEIGGKDYIETIWGIGFRMK